MGIDTSIQTRILIIFIMLSEVMRCWVAILIWLGLSEGEVYATSAVAIFSLAIALGPEFCTTILTKSLPATFWRLRQDREVVKPKAMSYLQEHKKADMHRIESKINRS